MNISKEYDRLYEEGVALFKEYNVCRIRNGKCGSHDGKFCCKGCKHLGKNGCRVKALGCKLWFCGSSLWQYPKAQQIPAKFYHRLNLLRDEAYKLRLYHFRASKAESLRQRKYSLKTEARYGWNNM